MLQTYYTGFKSGHIQRLPFLGRSLLIGLAFIASVLTVILTVVGFEKAIGGDLEKAQEMTRIYLSTPLTITLVIVVIALFIAGMNITAKRARDTGLPGWFFVATLIFVSALVSWLLSPKAALFINALVGAGLLLVPSNTFMTNNR